ncbi:MAG TPA: endolytic transglycosylase MltG, partial [Pyrinomonadaceae bacterium]|nr:endolytic transglycosylase MltG [Pyrinomonadaceae bacterium]
MTFVKITFGLIVAAILIGAGVSYWLYSSLTTAHSHDKANQFIIIEKGTSPPAIVDKLALEGVIASPFAMKTYLRTIGDSSSLQAGEYQFSSPITPLQVLKELEKGETQTIKLTIPEGFTRFDIAERIVEKFGKRADGSMMTEQEVVLLMDDTSLIRDIAPEARNLEGYMYPSTYSLPRDTKPADAIKTMVEQFRKV